MAQTPENYLPGSIYISPVQKTWTTTGNTNVVTDDSLTASSLPVVVPTSAYAGRWYISNITPTSTSTTTGVVTSGTFTITSSSSETATTTTFSYYLT